MTAFEVGLFSLLFYLFFHFFFIIWLRCVCQGEGARQDFCAEIGKVAQMMRLVLSTARLLGLRIGVSAPIALYKRPLKDILGILVSGASFEGRVKTQLALSRTYRADVQTCRPPYKVE